MNGLIAKHIFNNEVPCCYSTDIKEAFRIVEKFRRGTINKVNKVSACVEMIISDIVVDQDCICRIYAPDIEECEGVGYEMPEAICKATIVFIERYCL